MHTSHRGLAFLLSLGSLPLACTKNDNDTDDGGTSGTGSTTTPTTTGDTGASDTGVTTGDPDLCVVYAKHIAECNPTESSAYDESLMYCQLYKKYGFEADGKPCEDAFDALYVCLSNTDCAELANQDFGACEAEGAAISTACPTFGEADTDTEAPSETGSSTT
ncbi:MAG TPA: hypothetical protein VGB85_32115 [Nannocystis sp.]